MNVTKKFKLFASCQVVKGSRRSAIYDLQRGKIFTIPNHLADLLNTFNGSTIADIKGTTKSTSDHLAIDEYFEFLISKNLIFFSDSVESFPAIDFTWKSPVSITNAVIDSDSESKHDFQFIFNQLSQLGTESLELRFFDFIEVEALSLILDKLNNTRIRSVYLLMPASEDTDPAAIISLVRENPRIYTVTVHSANENKLSRHREELATICYTTTSIKSSDHCGFSNAQSMVANIQFFSESKNYNNCLNRKLSIDVRGQIKNCPALNESYGHYFEIDWTSVVSSSAFTKMWKITKDQIDVCRDCEFRYACLDCRAFSRSDRSKPLKCLYDPYSATWKNRC